MYGYIYKITNNLSGKFYIGKHKSETFDEKYWGSGRILKDAINSLGKENFTREIVEWCETLENLNDREKYWVSKTNCQDRDIGYNICDGGDGGPTVNNYRWYNDGEKDYYIDITRETPGENLVRGRIVDLSNVGMHGKFWVTDGKINLAVTEFEFEKMTGFKRGMTKHIKDKSVYSRKCSEEAKRRMSECRIGKHYSPRTEFKKGCAPLNKGKKWITNGVINKYINESDFNYWASQGWRFGCIQKRK